MAEIGLASSIVQVVSFGLATAQALYTFARTVSNASASLDRLAKHVESNSHILERLKPLLIEDENKSAANLAVLADAREAVINCELVFKQIQNSIRATTTSSKTQSRFKMKFKEVGRNVRYSLLDDAQIKEYRNELSQCQVSLNLILLIHWRPQREPAQAGGSMETDEIKRAVVEVLREGLDHARNSQVSSIASAVETFMKNVASDTTPPQTRDLSNDRNSANLGYKKSADDLTLDNVSRYNESRGATGNPSLRSQNSRGIESDITQVASNDTSSTPSRVQSLRSSFMTLASFPQGQNLCTTTSSESKGPSILERKMWIVKPGKDGSNSWKNPRFEENPITEAQKDAFALEHATKLLNNLASLDHGLSKAVRDHALFLQHQLLAIQIHRREARFRRSYVSSLDLLTEESNQSISHSGLTFQKVKASGREGMAESRQSKVLESRAELGSTSRSDSDSEPTKYEPRARARARKRRSDEFLFPAPQPIIIRNKSSIKDEESIQNKIISQPIADEPHLLLSTGTGLTSRNSEPLKAEGFRETDSRGKETTSQFEKEHEQAHSTIDGHTIVSMPAKWKIVREKGPSGTKVSILPHEDLVSSAPKAPAAPAALIKPSNQQRLLNVNFMIPDPETGTEVHEHFKAFSIESSRRNSSGEDETSFLAPPEKSPQLLMDLLNEEPEEQGFVDDELFGAQPASFNTEDALARNTISEGIKGQADALESLTDVVERIGPVRKTGAKKKAAYPDSSDIDRDSTASNGHSPDFLARENASDDMTTLEEAALHSDAATVGGAISSRSDGSSLVFNYDSTIEDEEAEEEASPRRQNEHLEKMITVTSLTETQSVRPQSPTPESSAPKTPSPRELLVENLAENTDEFFLHEKFASFGPIEEVTITREAATGQSLGRGHVHFAWTSDATKAARATDNTECNGRTIHVSSSSYSHKREESPTGLNKLVLGDEVQACMQSPEHNEQLDATISAARKARKFRIIPEAHKALRLPAWKDTIDRASKDASTRSSQIDLEALADTLIADLGKRWNSEGVS